MHVYLVPCRYVLDLLPLSPEYLIRRTLPYSPPVYDKKKKITTYMANVLPCRKVALFKFWVRDFQINKQHCCCAGDAGDADAAAGLSLLTVCPVFRFAAVPSFHVVRMLFSETKRWARGREVGLPAGVYKYRLPSGTVRHRINTTRRVEYVLSCSQAIIIISRKPAVR